MNRHPAEPPLSTPPIEEVAPAGSDAGRPAAAPVKEIGGPAEADPTRYGDWTVKGRCIDF